MAETTTTVAGLPVKAVARPAIVGAVFDERDGPLPGLLLALTVLAGIVDATSILRLGDVFVATMTGNVVFIGLAIAGVHRFALGTIAIAFGGFAIGSLLGVRAYRAAGPHRGAALRNVMGVKCALAACVSIAAIASGGDFSVGVRDLVVVLISMSMGAQLAAIRNLKIVDLPTVAVTLTMSGLITERGPGFDAIALRRIGAVLSFFTGALVGGLLVHFVSLTAALALGLVIILAVTFGAHRVSAAEAEWTRPRTAPAPPAPPVPTAPPAPAAPPAPVASAAPVATVGDHDHAADRPQIHGPPDGDARWITEQQLIRLTRDGWVELSRERRPDEHRALVTLWHPAQPLGDGDDRHVAAVTTQRLVPLTPPAQLSLFSQ